ncbi:hypothetical protein ACFXKJ_23575 [Kitasatospora indigofera]|uniref:hypothetical protein n=1 Tax=Kitasatospora indigofera TaxID=67307 RepID=UPI0036B1C139
MPIDSTRLWRGQLQQRIVTEQQHVSKDKQQRLAATQTQRVVLLQWQGQLARSSSIRNQLAPNSTWR